ncbi:TolC family protein [uncultured Sanguibacteroides sp.]|uniref:TolC family protein n=1 Tax=uncultured Sanguibacteroides sp. TaxID=1635151 RepID=UPI0025FC48D3|nr:TolC family protein [uncultured Sanguibacteroides sp.]
MIRSFFLILFICLCTHTFGQLTLDSCRQKAHANYPLVRQYKLIELSENYSLANAAKGNLPQISLSGKASYQSDVTTLPVQLSGLSLKTLPKDQYQIMLEVKQNVWDGGHIHYQKQQIKASSDEAERQLDVNMYALNERVNQVYFGILLLDEQLLQNALLQEELERNLQNIIAYRDNGIANDADVDAVQVEILNTRQQRIGLETNRIAYLRMLSLLTGEELAADTKISKPDIPQYPLPLTINRPELLFYTAQEHHLNVKEQSLRTGYHPQFSLFAQGAYGNPGLNMLKNAFEPYYIVGARLSWNFGSLYTLRNDKRKLETERQQIQSNRDLFLFNTRMQLAEQEGAITTLRKQMETDNEIIRLRVNIRKSAEAKVANGTLTVTEMLRELTNESLAKQNKALHEIQLLMDIYQQKHLTNL